MNDYYAESIFQYIHSKVVNKKKHTDQPIRVMMMLPSLPFNNTLNLIEKLSVFALKDENIEVSIKIAESLGKTWHKTYNIKSLIEKKYIDHSGNLTSYRNQIPNDDRKDFLLVLIGTKRVADSSSLDDFHQCDTYQIWNDFLRRSFSKWIEWALHSNGVGYENQNVSRINLVLTSIYKRGKADLFGIADFLGNKLELSVQNGEQAEKAILHNLGHFKLPNFSGFQFLSHKPFSLYLDCADRFFSYEMFMEKEKASKAINIIKKIKEEISAKGNQEEYASSEKIGSFADWEAFLDGLAKYIEEEDNVLKRKLFQCDFVNIWESILKYKVKSDNGTKPEREIRIKGDPIEVILSAMLTVLIELKKGFESDAIKIEEIEIYSKEFKADYESRDLAKLKLKSLIGGIDEFFNACSGESSYICIPSEISADSVKIKSSFLNDEISIKTSKVSEPYLKFKIRVKIKNYAEDNTNLNDENEIYQVFKWRLPETHPYRVVSELILWARSKIQEMHPPILPVFHVPHYDELMLAKDEEEINRVMLHSIRSQDSYVTNLLTRNWQDTQDSLLKFLKKLSRAYVKMVITAAQDGVFSIFHSSSSQKDLHGGSEWSLLRKAYENAANAFVAKDGEAKETKIAAILMRAFFFIQHHEKSNIDEWVNYDYEPNAVVTIMHPSLIEMLYSRINFLFAGFNSLLKRILEKSTKNLINLWRNYVDLADIKMPIPGLLQDANETLNTDIQGMGLIHRIGRNLNEDSILSTRLLIQYEGYDESDISDSDMFRETRDSKLLTSILNRYVEIHPHARDGISLSIYRNEDIQPIIAAIHHFLKQANKKENGLLAESRLNPFVLNITVFTQSGDDVTVAKWMHQWRERWEASETENRLSHYMNCQFSLAHRIIPEKDGMIRFMQMIREGMEVDLAVLYDFIAADSEGDLFKEADEYCITKNTLLFPVLEKVFITQNTPDRRSKRGRILSNRQFAVARLYTELLVRLKHPNVPPGQQHVVLGYGNYQPWDSVINQFHQNAEWVVCIDPSIDERLIRGTEGIEKSEYNREIVGFGSGVGLHGEKNFTISTQHIGIDDIQYKLAEAIHDKLYTDWSRDLSQKVAISVIRENRQLAGLSAIRATGKGTYIHDFMAYAVVSKIVRSQKHIDDLFCDQLISLDAYTHWFHGEESETHPDLLWITSKIRDGRLHLELVLIECKLAELNQDHIDKAYKQIENGLKVLVPLFEPISEQKGAFDDCRPDQRYWWLQLHRLIASRSTVVNNNETDALNALERLTEGDFSVSWRAGVMYFRTDKSKDIIENKENTNRLVVNKKDLPIPLIQIGRDSVKAICLNSKVLDIEWLNLNKDTDDSNDDAMQSNIEQSTPKSSPTSVSAPESKETSTLQITQGESSKKNDVTTRNRIPERILLGTSTQGGRKVYWEFGHKKLQNRHIMIFGSSGSGKTYAIQCLLYELGKAKQNSIIVDYTEGLKRSQMEPLLKEQLDPQQHLIKNKPLPINPFLPQTYEIEGISVSDKAPDIATRVSGVFAEVYTLGDQQRSALYNAIKKGVNVYKKSMSLEHMMDELNEISQRHGSIANSARSILSKIEPFVDLEPFQDSGQTSWDQIANDSKRLCHILQLAGYTGDASRLITEFILIDLYRFYRNVGSKDNPLAIVLDEIQNLDHRGDGILAKLITEGRKFGVALIMATQIMSGLPKDGKDRLFLADHKLFFKPSDTEIKAYAEILSHISKDKKETWVNRLSTLSLGECYSIGPSLNSHTGKLERIPFRIKINSLQDRIRNV